MTTIRTFAGKTPKVGAGVFLAENAALVGDVEIGDESSIWYSATIRGDVMPIRIGAGTSIQDSSVVHVTSGAFGTTIGSRVTVGHNAIIHACDIEDDVLIGMGSIILDGARIRRWCFVGAGALVTPGTDIPEGSLVLGAPARVKRPLTEAERTGIRESAEHYVELTRRYLAVGA